MASVWITGEDRKKQMKQNIIKHRRTVLGFLEILHNTDLKPKIKSRKNELLELDLFLSNTRKPEPLPSSALLGNVKEEFRVKKELYERDNTNDSSDVSVGSVERWNGVCQTPDFGSFKDSTRGSSSSSTNENSRGIENKTLYYDNSKAHYVYNNSSASEQRRKQFRTRNREELHHKLRFKEPLLRIEHNAKERECRMLIAKSFSNLGKCCSYLDNKRRTPSKFSILVAAKKECDSLKIYEKKLLVEKEYWLTANNQLKRRLKSNAMSSDNIITIDD